MKSVEKYEFPTLRSPIKNNGIAFIDYNLFPEMEICIDCIVNGTYEFTFAFEI